MAWVHPEIKCTLHPDEKQHPGICSSCLRERLTKLPSFPLNMNPPSAPVTCSSAPSSVCASPHSNHRHLRMVSSTCAPRNPRVFVVSDRSRLGRSRSGTCGNRKGVRNGADGMKKQGFWSKLIRSTSLKTRGVFLPSKHAKE